MERNRSIDKLPSLTARSWHSYEQSGRECYGMSRGSRVVYTVGSKFRSAALDVILKASLGFARSAVLFSSIILGRLNSSRQRSVNHFRQKWSFEMPFRLAEEERRQGVVRG